MPRIFVELFAEAILSRYVVIDFPEDATLNELPWEEISEAADSRGIPWEEWEEPKYVSWRRKTNVRGFAVREGGQQ